MKMESRFRNLEKRRYYQVFIVFLSVFVFTGLLTITALADHAGDALLFDGVGEYVRLGDTGELMGGTGWQSEKTVSLWIKPGTEAAPATDPPSGELIVGIDYPQIFGINRANFNGQDRIWIWNADSNGFDVIGVPYTGGEWMHLAVVHSGGVLRAYQNGVLVGTRTSGATYAPANGRMYMGGSGRSAAARYFGGEIDEVRFWNIGLGSAEIATWWDVEITDQHPNWSNLTAYYQMSAGTGVVLPDDSGNGRDGDLLGGMGDANWVPSEALGHTNPTPTVEVATATSTWTATAVVATATATALPPSPTPTAVVPTFTSTPVPPTSTPTQLSPSPTSTQVSPTSTPVTGGPDFALLFDGVGEYVGLGDTGELLGGAGWQSEKTVSLWLRPGTASAPATDPPSGELIVGIDYPQIFGINRANYNGQDRIWIWNADSNGFDVIGVPYAGGEWMHLAVVHSGGVLRAYQNGVLVGTRTSGATYAPSNGRMYIGGSGRSAVTRYFGGEIDEVRFWNIGLGSAEIAAWWDRAITDQHPNRSNLTAYYQMSAGTGVVLPDDSGNGRDGDLLGGMGDANWVPSGALEQTGPTPTAVVETATPTLEVPTPTPTAVVATATPTWTATAQPPSPTPTAVVPTFTPTPVPPTPTPVTSGSGFALSFDGNNDFVELAETAYIMDAGWEGTKTISLWVKPNGNGTDCAYNDVANCESILGDRPRWWGITRGIRNGVDRIWIWNADASMNDFIDTIAIEYTPDEWVHIAFVHHNGELIAYKNGVQVGYTLSAETLQPYTGGLPVLHIGGVINSPSANVTFNGEIDEVKIWSAARSESQIQEGMYQILTGDEIGLSAYYRMSNGFGLILTDDSINSWDGTLFDGARGVPPDGSPPQWVSPGPF